MTEDIHRCEIMGCVVPGIVEHDIIMMCITLRKSRKLPDFEEKKELSGFRHNASLILDGICNHAPTKGATDPDDGDDNKDKFQSTLPRRERQDSQKDSQKRFTISIHAPAKGATAIFHKSSNLYCETLTNTTQINSLTINA